MIDSATENRIHLFDPVGLINDNYASHGIRVRRSTRSFDGGSQLTFAVETNGDGKDSEPSSPRLWKTSSPNSHSHSHSHGHHQPMSPNSRTQAIARGRRELMDMIKDMPESFYELSLRDIVEQKSLLPADHEPSKGKVDDEIKFPSKAMEYPDEKKVNETQNQKQRKIGKKVSKSESKKKMVRSKSIDNGGFLLKTSVFPISFGLSKKKKSLSTSGSLKVAPKPPLHAPASASASASASSKAVKSAEKDWWKKKSCISSESESAGLSSSNSGSGRSSGSSSRSSSTSSRRGHSSRFLPNCCSFKAKK